ncbi:MAG: methyltransferase [Mesorhizobium amorphae]|nr:MAG: methyltransferase [Mesorhizobium amorphae]
MPVSEYMALCLLDPTEGYYTRREPFGAGGDFVTAPEVSQMFGELVGVWLWLAWEAAGKPDDAVLVEVGPGRGTLMKDALRALAALDREWAARLRACLVEASPRLRAVQRETLGGRPVEWFDRIEDLPKAPLLLVANEFMDALPIRQYVKTADGFRERVVGLDERNELCFLAGLSEPDPAWLPPDAADAALGAIVEAAPAREAAMAALCERIGATGGAALLIDYGHLRSGLGDTLQAVRAHRFAPVLEAPGHADLTSHVDFASLAAVARSAGLSTFAATQGEFLLGLGLLERAGAIGRGKDADTQARIRGEAERLAGPDAMGSLFKVLGVARPGVALPALAPLRSA